MKETAFMISVNDQIRTSITRIEQLKNQRKSKERREQEAKRKMKAHHHFTSGRIIDKYFPDIEPAALEKLLRALVGNPELLARLKDEAGKLA